MTDSVSLRQLKWIILGGPLVFLAIVDVISAYHRPDLLHRGRAPS
jgi:hypothetical protein